MRIVLQRIFCIVPASTKPLDANFGICDYVPRMSHLPNKVHIKGLDSISFRSLNIYLTSASNSLSPRYPREIP